MRKYVVMSDRLMPLLVQPSHLDLMVFLTVVVAILVEKAVTKLFKVLQNQASDLAQPMDMRRTPGRKRPAEDDELLAEIEEKDKMEWSKETALAFYERTTAMHLDYIDNTDRLKEKEKDTDRATHDLSLILSSHKEQAQQKVGEVQDKLDDLREKLESTEGDKEEVQQMYDDLSKLHNDSLTEKKQVESNLRLQCLRERDKARSDLREIKTKLEEITTYVLQ